MVSSQPSGIGRGKQLASLFRHLTFSSPMVNLPCVSLLFCA